MSDARSRAVCRLAVRLKNGCWLEFELDLLKNRSQSLLARRDPRKGLRTLIDGEERRPRAQGESRDRQHLLLPRRPTRDASSPCRMSGEGDCACFGRAAGDGDEVTGMSLALMMSQGMLHPDQRNCSAVARSLTERRARTPGPSAASWGCGAWVILLLFAWAMTTRSGAERVGVGTAASSSYGVVFRTP